MPQAHAAGALRFMSSSRGAVVSASARHHPDALEGAIKSGATPAYPPRMRTRPASLSRRRGRTPWRTHRGHRRPSGLASPRRCYQVYRPRRLGCSAGTLPEAVQAGGVWTARSQSTTCLRGWRRGRTHTGLLPPVFLPQELHEKRLPTDVPMDLQDRDESLLFLYELTCFFLEEILWKIYVLTFNRKVLSFLLLKYKSPR